MVHKRSPIRAWGAACATGAVLSVALSLGLEAHVAVAAPPADDHSGNEHAHEDLVGTPITEIERQTRIATPDDAAFKVLLEELDQDRADR